jgi:hypothetical protein
MAINAVTRRLLGVPYFVTAHLGLVPRAHYFTDEELHQFCYTLGTAGVDYIRLFPIDVWADEPLHPFRKHISGEYGLKLYNAEYFHQLRRVRRIANTWKVSIYFDLFDQCSAKGDGIDINPWFNNRNGVHGIYDTSDDAMDFYKHWVTKVVSAVGLRGGYKTKNGNWKLIKPNLFGLGNELKFPRNRRERHLTAYIWGRGLAEHLRRLGYRKEIMWSAETETGRALYDFISPLGQLVSDCCKMPHTGPWENKSCVYCGKPCKVITKAGVRFEYTDTVFQRHGWIDTTIDPEIENIVGKTTRRRKFAYSDDGVNYRWTNTSGYDGICISTRRFCSAPTRKVISLCRYMKDNVRHKSQIHHIEQLPRSVAEWTQPLSKITLSQRRIEREVNIYQKIAREVWGVDITRRYPRWLKEKHGVKE